LLIAGAIVLFSLIGYWSDTSFNPITGENQRVGGLSPEQEIALGLRSLPQMAQQFRGFSQDLVASNEVRQTGARLVNALYHRLRDQDIDPPPYPFAFHLLADRQVVNAFALPGGQIFVTEALYSRLTEPGQLAGVLGHEIGHVIQRHGAERIAQNRLMQGLVSAAGVAGGDVSSAQLAEAIAQLVSMKYNRADELESDRWGIHLMVMAGYHPEHMLEVMDILEQATSGGGPPEFMATHPKPANRREYIEKIIAEKFPQGIPAGLQ
jgi:predicted Zn-dependent protease